MNDAVKYELKHPIEIKAERSDKVIDTITTLDLKRIQGRHLKAMDKVQGENAKTLALIASCSGLPLSTLDEIDGEDFAELAEIVAGFLGKRQPTGATSSET